MRSRAPTGYGLDQHRRGLSELDALVLLAYCDPAHRIAMRIGGWCLPTGDWQGAEVRSAERGPQALQAGSVVPSVGQVVFFEHAERGVFVRCQSGIVGSVRVTKGVPR